MADLNIKRAIVENQSLPVINSDVEGYILRYRIISDDKNRSSSWSEPTVIQPEFSYTIGNIHHNKSGDINTLAWDAVSILKNSVLVRKAHEYDIWLKWDRSDNGDWIYLERIDGTSISFLTPQLYTINGNVQLNSPNRLSVEIFLRGTPITRGATFLKVYEGGPWTV